MKLTKWHPAHIKPVRKGVYEVRNNVKLNSRNKNVLSGINKRFFDGKNWLVWEGGDISIFGTHSSHEWRGIAK